MKRRSFRPPAAFGSLFFAAVLVMAGPLAAQPPAHPEAEAPVLVPGDSWTIRYSNGIRAQRRFLREQSGILIFEVTQTGPGASPARGQLHLTRDLATARILDAGGKELQRFDPHSLGLRFPLAVGRTWEETCLRLDAGRLVGKFVGRYRVVGLETVTVPAGTFEAFRVEGETFDPQAPAMRWRFTHWYAPEARIEARLRAVEPDGSETSVELFEFRPAGAAPAATPPPGTEIFLGVWEGYWQEIVLATKLTVEKITGDTASVIYWRGAYLFPGFQRPSQQYLEGRFRDARTLTLDVWDDAARRWSEVTYSLNSDGTLTGKWLTGGAELKAILNKEP